MSVFKNDGTQIAKQIKQFLVSLSTQGTTARLVLLNFFLEDRIPHAQNSQFTKAILSNGSNITDFRNLLHTCISQQSLSLQLPSSFIPIHHALHFTSRNYLVEKGFINISTDEPPPKKVTITKPLGTGKQFIWLTTGSSLDIDSADSTIIRNVVGLSTANGDYLYCFKIDTRRHFWIPSVFDACGSPPYKPANKNLNWGMTRNLIDDSDGVPELLTEPLSSLADSPSGFLIEPMINSNPPTGYSAKRVSEYNSNPERIKWGIP